jgi:gamma-glutamylputrescine oxidase
MTVHRSPSSHVSDAACAPTTWYHASAQRPFAPTFEPSDLGLDPSLQADVVIIGAGFTGVSAALDLAQAGLKVVVLEAGLIGAGASGRNGGLTCSGWRHDQRWLESRLGVDDSRKLWNLAEDAKADLLARMAHYGIDADFQPGQIYAAHTPRLMDALDDDAAYMEDQYAYLATTRLDRAACAQALGTDVYLGGWRDRTAGHLHPLKLLYGLAGAAHAAGAHFLEGTRALEIGQAGQRRFVRTQDSKWTCEHVLLCGDGYLDGIQADVEARVLPISSFVLATDPLDPGLEVLPANDSAMDTRFVVNYWRKSKDNRLIFGGGEKYTPSWPMSAAEFVRANMLKIYPGLSGVKISHAWGGALGLTPTRLPYVRKVAPGIVSASGYSGQGVILAPYFGRVLAQVVLGTHQTYDLLARLPAPRFVGGRALRWPLLTAALSWYALRDKLP